ncbi:MAG: lasso peptide biosynthesis B2 protein, partial [Coleofasciculaceae cyanobacterium]
MNPLTLLVQKTHTWKKLSLYENYLLLQALTLLPLLALSLKLLGFKRTQAILSNFLPPELYSDAPSSSAAILPIVKIVKIATKYYSWATCLKKSLVLWYLLRRQGIAAELQIGTRFEQGEFQAHAWVEYQGCVVGDRQGVKQHFTAFDNLDPKLIKNSANLSQITPVATTQGTSPKKKEPKQWPPEIELLLYCSRSCIDTATAERVENLLQQDLDWNYLLQQACEHRVFLLLHQNLILNYPQLIPQNILPQLQAYCSLRTARNLATSKQLCQLLDLFNHHQLKVIPFKGPVLAAFAYNNLALREFCDLDLLIDEKDYPQVKELLITQGYKPQTQPRWGQNMKGKRGNLDLHWQLTPPCFPYRVDFPQLWQRCQTISILNQPVNVLSPEDLLLILCVQIFKDVHYRQERLIKICDIAELIGTNCLDWGVVSQQAQIKGSERLLLFGLGITQQLFGVEIPLEFQQKITNDRVVYSYINHASQHLFPTTDKQKQIKQRGLFAIFRLGLLSG